MTDYPAGELVIDICDTHVYTDHVEAVKTQITRVPNPFPILKINPEVKDIFDFKAEDFEIVNYNPHKNLPMKLIVASTKDFLKDQGKENSSKDDQEEYIKTITKAMGLAK